MEPSKIKMFKITNFFWRVYITGHVGSWFSPTRDQTHTLLQWKHGVLTTGPLEVHLLLLFSCSVVSDSLQPHGLQHARLPCPLPSPRPCSNSCPLSQWYHPTISSSVILFSSCLQSFPASGSFLMSWLFAWGGQNIGASALVLPMNIQGWFPLGLTDLISLQSKGPSRVFSNTSKASVLWCPTFFISSIVTVL